MPRDNEDLEKKTIRLHRGDADILQQFYPRLGYNKAIRVLVRNHIKTLQERTAQTTANAIPDIEIE